MIGIFPAMLMVVAFLWVAQVERQDRQRRADAANTMWAHVREVNAASYTPQEALAAMKRLSVYPYTPE